MVVDGNIHVCVPLFSLGSNGFAFVEFYETQDAVRWMDDNKVSTYMELVVNCLPTVR